MPCVIAVSAPCFPPFPCSLQQFRCFHLLSASSGMTFPTSHFPILKNELSQKQEHNLTTHFWKIRSLSLAYRFSAISSTSISLFSSAVCLFRRQFSNLPFSGKTEQLGWKPVASNPPFSLLTRCYSIPWSKNRAVEQIHRFNPELVRKGPHK